jgi:hypothetical protein
MKTSEKLILFFLLISFIYLLHLIEFSLASDKDLRPPTAIPDTQLPVPSPEDAAKERHKIRDATSRKDKEPPIVEITYPTSHHTTWTHRIEIILRGTASDYGRIKEVTWANDRGIKRTCSGTTNWRCGDIAVVDGTNTITVTAEDAAGNLGTDTITVNVDVGDTISPTVRITFPTENTTWRTDIHQIRINGTASDNVVITGVYLFSDLGDEHRCEFSTHQGLTSFYCWFYDLKIGSNNITVTARDDTGNLGSDSLEVIYTTSSSDTTPPTVTITSPTSNPTYTSDSTSLTLRGNASDTGGVTEVRWSNDQGGSGSCSGTTSWTCNRLTLIEGANNITVTAEDAAGNPGTDTIAVTYTAPAPSDGILPTVTILGPTSNPIYNTSRTPIALTGTASDNEGVTRVTWVNDQGGGGSCSGTSNWTCRNINITFGTTNNITVTAEDAAGNPGTDSIAITYGRPGR